MTDYNKELKYEFKGTHYFASLKSCNSDILFDNLTLTSLFKNAIIKSGATILNYTEHIFDNNAITFVFLLSESHCSVHTYPEYKSLFIDLFTCGEKINNEIFNNIIVEALEPTIISKQVLIRD